MYFARKRFQFGRFSGSFRSILASVEMNETSNHHLGKVIEGMNYPCKCSHSLPPFVCRLLVKLVARWLVGQKVEDVKADELCEGWCGTCSSWIQKSTKRGTMLWAATIQPMPPQNNKCSTIVTSIVRTRVTSCFEPLGPTHY